MNRIKRIVLQFPLCFIVVLFSLYAQTSAYAETGASTLAQRTAAASSQAVNVNTADAETLASVLDGVGLKRAAAIVAYRDANGAFKSAEDLMKVKGLGAKFIKRNRAKLSF